MEIKNIPDNVLTVILVETDDYRSIMLFYLVNRRFMRICDNEYFWYLFLRKIGYNNLSTDLELNELKGIVASFYYNLLKISDPRIASTVFFLSNNQDIKLCFAELDYNISIKDFMSYKYPKQIKYFLRMRRKLLEISNEEYSQDMRDFKLILEYLITVKNYFSLMHPNVSKSNDILLEIIHLKSLVSYDTRELCTISKLLRYYIKD